MILVVIAIFARSTWAVDLTEKLYLREELVQATQKIKPFLVDSKVKHRLGLWLTHDENRSYVTECQLKLRPFFQSDKILGPVCYYLRQDDNNKRNTSLDFINRYILELKSALLEIADDPQYADIDRLKARAYSDAFFKRRHLPNIQTCLKPALEKDYTKPNALQQLPFQQVASCFQSNFPKIDTVPYFGLNIAKSFPNHPGHAISETGWISGNKVEYFTYTDLSESLALKLSEKFHLIETLYPMEGRGNMQSFLETDPRDVFTESEGFWSFENHPIWNQKEGIFAETRKVIDSAQESLFIDIFFLGNTLGASLAKHFVSLLETKPRLKIFILRDNKNHFGHEKEMLPVFNFLQAYSSKHPDRLVVVQALIEEHRSGLPPFMHSLVTDELLEKSGIQSHLDLYGRAVSDHSKVVVADGMSQKPVALVGSKNWTDAAGALCYDEVVKITGPAAAVVLDDYYYDMREALRKKTNFTPEQIQSALKPFDVLNRNDTQTVNNIDIPSAGNISLRTGFNNYDSTRTNAVDEVVQLILFAKKNIFIKDQFLFDRNVIASLIEVKNKNPQLDIRIILEPVETSQPRGLPNILYVDLLKDAGIETKFKRLHVGWSQVASQKAQNLHIEYHMKTISVDGQYLIS
ncbi:MAG: hypothetical protein HYS98_02670 [Deltaproteobacteria bacterium]|nr:hypothetical protein [Deltaproteobacteria bacterium]